MNAKYFIKNIVFIIVLFLLPGCFQTDQSDQVIAQDFFDYKSAVYPFELPPLPYAYDALKPHIDAETMRVHHAKHHQAYIKNLNAVLAANEDLQKISLKDLITNLDELPEEALPSIVKQGGGVYNHAMFWTMMTPNGPDKPQGDLLKAIERDFENYDNFKALFSRTAKKIFGSGWVWLCVNNDERLVIVSSSNQSNPLSGGLTPIMCLDVWEHAYYLKYKNRRQDYVSAWWNVVNWPQIEALYKEAQQGKVA